MVTVIATLNDYWQVLKLDVLLADPEPKKTTNGETEETPSSDAAETNDDDTVAGDAGEKEATADESDEGKTNEQAVVEEDVVEEANDSGRKCDTCNSDHGSHRDIKLKE